MSELWCEQSLREVSLLNFLRSFKYFRRINELKSSRRLLVSIKKLVSSLISTYIAQRLLLSAIDLAFRSFFRTQTALTLAVAEGKYEFEHRDLHWGNLLIAPTEEKFSEYRIAGKTFKVLNHGVKVTIIDYSLSRMVYDGAVLYDNLARDDELFESQGDYQFDIYRLMRARVE